MKENLNDVDPFLSNNSTRFIKYNIDKVVNNQVKKPSLSLDKHRKTLDDERINNGNITESKYHNYQKKFIWYFIQ